MQAMGAMMTLSLLQAEPEARVVGAVVETVQLAVVVAQAVPGGLSPRYVPGELSEVLLLPLDVFRPRGATVATEVLRPLVIVAGVVVVAGRSFSLGRRVPA